MKEKTQKRRYEVTLWQLFVTFFKLGAFTFGGGYAMIALLEEELVAKKRWITSADMLDMVVIAESTPGVIAVNTATSVGYRTHGVSGAIIATLGVTLPSFVIIAALSFAIEAFQDNTWYQAAFTGIQACVGILIVNAFVKMAGQLERDWFSAILLLAAFACATFTKFNVIYLIMMGAVIGIAYTLIKNKVAQKKQAADGISGDSDSGDASLDNAPQDEDAAGGSDDGDGAAQSSAENFNGDGAAPQSSDEEVKK